MLEKSGYSTMKTEIELSSAVEAGRLDFGLRRENEYQLIKLWVKDRAFRFTLIQLAQSAITLSQLNPSSVSPFCRSSVARW